ncbi:MAG TPA: DUF5954 family protein [Trebonia sp.]|jgi:hypothetical protein|nr:DUF5954 family protein [Trebonia sp.]
MSDASDSVPAYQAIRMGVPDTPAGQLADAEAWLARGPYPEVVAVTEPSFLVAREREQGGWEVLPHFGLTGAREARAALAIRLRMLAQQAARSGDPAAATECARVAAGVVLESAGEARAAGARLRVVRAGLFIRTGPSGPEPPRGSDPGPAGPDAAGDQDAGDQDPGADPTAGFVIDPAIVTGMSAGILKVDLLSLGPRPGDPPPAREDARRAAQAYPGGVLLPAAFMLARQSRAGGWGPGWPRTWPCPQAARDFLASHFRLGPAAPRVPPPGTRDAQAGDLLIAGRSYRVVRVERLVRMGPDGPEGPRRCDQPG